MNITFVWRQIVLPDFFCICFWYVAISTEAAVFLSNLEITSIHIYIVPRGIYELETFYSFIVVS